MVVQHNLRAMNSNRMLGLTASAQSKSTEKLSSGYKINRAADDAAGLSISEKMRKQIRGLSQASLNASDGISAVQTAEGALNEVQDMLQRMNELAVKASNGTMSEDDRGYIQDEIEQLIDEIDRVAGTTKFNETYLLKGDANVTDESKFVYKAAEKVTKNLVYFDENGDQKEVNIGDYASILQDDVTYYDASAIENPQLVGEKCTATIADGANVTTILGNTDEELFRKDANGDYVRVGLGTEVTTTTTYYHVNFDEGGNVVSATVTAAASTTYCVVATAGVVWDADGNELKANDKFELADVTNYYTNVSEAKYDSAAIVPIDEATGNSGKAQFTDKDGNEIAENGLYRYVAYEDGEVKLTGDLRYADGTKVKAEDIGEYIGRETFDRGALSLKLHVGADATDNNQIQIDIQAMDSDRLGIKEVNVSGATDEGALNAIETIKEAIQMISTQRSALGAVQNRLEHTIANLDNVVENTTAAESQIRDTDMATEMVKYSNNNILAQAGQAMLAQANQANQGVLSILG